jgi:hypothetical protein
VDPLAGKLLGNSGVHVRARIGRYEVPFLEEVTSMTRLVAPSLALLAMSVGTAAGANLKSGVEVGNPPGAFQVKDCTGPSKGKSLCYR